MSIVPLEHESHYPRSFTWRRILGKKTSVEKQKKQTCISPPKIPSRNCCTRDGALIVSTSQLQALWTKLLQPELISEQHFTMLLKAQMSFEKLQCSSDFAPWPMLSTSTSLSNSAYIRYLIVSSPRLSLLALLQRSAQLSSHESKFSILDLQTYIMAANNPSSLQHRLRIVLELVLISAHHSSNHYPIFYFQLAAHIEQSCPPTRLYSLVVLDACECLVHRDSISLLIAFQPRYRPHSHSCLRRNLMCLPGTLFPS